MSKLKEKSEYPEDSAFHPDNLGVVTYITLERIYDLLTIIAGNTDMERTRAVIALHKAGQTLAPEPAFSNTESPPVEPIEPDPGNTQIV